MNMLGNIDIRKDARRAMVGKMWTILGLMVLFAVINAIISYLLSLIFGPTVSSYSSISYTNEVYYSLGLNEFVQVVPDKTPFIAYVSSLFNTVVSLALVPVQLGISFLCLDIVRGVQTKSPYDYLLDPYKKIAFALQLILAYVLKYVFVILWTMLLIIPGIIKGLGYSQTSFIMYDNPDMKAMDALRESEKLMKGKRMQLFVMYLYFVALMLLSVFTLGIALLWIAPYMSLACARFYDAAKLAYYGAPEEPKPDEFVVDDTAAETPFTEL